MCNKNNKSNQKFQFYCNLSLPVSVYSVFLSCVYYIIYYMQIGSHPKLLRFAEFIISAYLFIPYRLTTWMYVCTKLVLVLHVLYNAYNYAYTHNSYYIDGW